jgi:transcriptional regulator with GAF, ATPase, and Fis domain
MAEPLPQRELIEALHAVLRQVAEPLHVLKTVLEQAVARTQAERGLFVEVGAAGQFEYRVLHGFARGALDHANDSFSRSLFARVIQTGDAVHLANVLEDPELAGAESIRRLHAGAVMCVPIRADDSISAIVHLEHHAVGHFTSSHRENLRALLDIAGPTLAALRASRSVIDERDRLRASEGKLRAEAEENRRELATFGAFTRFVGRAPTVRALEDLVRRVAATSFPVLLLGETGTGKSIVARAIHSASPRARQPFVTVFCPSLERGMVEAELFGHRRGAFTGAAADRIGKVQAAHQGTLFLDEIGDLPLEIQPKLLRLLQEQTYERIGDPTEHHVDLRIIAATNRDLEREVAEGRFRLDLFERLNFVPVRIPPLRERTEDIPRLLRHALDQHEQGRWIEISPEAARRLSELDFAWPGNVRHLEQLAARLSLGGTPSPVSAEDLLALLDRSRAGDRPASADLSTGLPALLADAERSWLEKALRVHPESTRAELAAQLKISESALYKKLKQYGFTKG